MVCNTESTQLPAGVGLFIGKYFCGCCLLITRTVLCALVSNKNDKTNQNKNNILRMFTPMQLLHRKYGPIPGAGFFFSYIFNKKNVNSW
jgi:hypothetical protein